MDVILTLTPSLPVLLYDNACLANALDFDGSFKLFLTHDEAIPKYCRYDNPTQQNVNK